LIAGAVAPEALKFVGRFGVSPGPDLRKNRMTWMPMIDANGCPIWVEVAGPEGAPVLILSNSLGTDLHMWDVQAPAFAQRFRLVRYDRRGHGKSGLPGGPYTMERLGRDALAIADSLGFARFDWCGLSMGGMEGMWLAAHAPERIDRLVLCNTTCHYPEPSYWNERITAIRASGGPAALADRIMGLWFSAQFRARAPAAVAPLRAMLAATRMQGYIACCEAIRDMDHRDLLARIASPTLIIAGQHDQATPVAAAQFIHSRIAGASLAILDAAHISNVEQSALFAETVLRFLAPRGG
jgi:3-oxoadipate enol-lactonase